MKMDARTVRMQGEGKGDAERRVAAPTSRMRKVAGSPWARAFVAAALLGGASCREVKKEDLPNVAVEACSAKGCTEIKAHGNIRVKKGDKVTVVMVAQEDSICHASEQHDVDSASGDFPSSLGDTATIKCDVVEEKKPQQQGGMSGTAIVMMAVMASLAVTAGTWAAIKDRRERKGPHAMGPL